MRAIYEHLYWLCFRAFCWLFGYNGFRVTCRVDAPNVGLLSELWHGYYPYLNKVLMRYTWTRHCEGPDKLYYLVEIVWGPAKLDPYHKTRHTIKEVDLGFLADNIISVVAIKL